MEQLILEAFTEEDFRREVWMRKIGGGIEAPQPAGARSQIELNMPEYAGACGTP